ncbi:MAG: hypothetical protein AABX86_02515 [Nanoarchaeota archaeon]
MKEKLNDSEKEIILANKDLINQEHIFEKRVFFTLLALIISLVIFSYKYVIEQNLDLRWPIGLTAFLLIFLEMKAIYAYNNLRKDYKKLINHIKNGSIAEISILPRSFWNKFFIWLETTLLWFSIFVLIFNGNYLTWVIVGSILFSSIVFFSNRKFVEH